MTSPSSGDEPAAAVVAVLVDDLLQLVADDLPLPLGGAGQDVLVVGDLELDLGQLVDDLLPLQGREAAELHVEDGLGLDLVDVEEVDEALAGDVDGLRRRMRAMTSSRASSALTRPRRMWARSSALRSR